MTIQEKFAQALPLINSGDIGLFRGKAVISDAIEIVDDAYFSHSEPLYIQDNKLMCIDATGKGVNADFLINTVDSEVDFVIIRPKRTNADKIIALTFVADLATNKVKYNYLFYVKFVIYKLIGRDFSHITERNADVCSTVCQVYTTHLTPPIFEGVDLITPQYIWDNKGNDFDVIVDKGL